MSNEELEQYLRSIGWNTDNIIGVDRKPYMVIRGYEIPAGSLAGTTCDIAIEKPSTVPYVPLPAIHTNPILVEMNMSNHLRTMASGVGPGWQYWSRVVRDATPKGIVTHIATIFSEV